MKTMQPVFRSQVYQQRRGASASLRHTARPLLPPMTTTCLPRKRGVLLTSFIARSFLFWKRQTSSASFRRYNWLAHLRLQRSLERSLAGKGNPSAYPTSEAANTSTPSHAFWPWHPLLPGLLFGSDPLRLRLPLCFPEPHALPLIIPGNEPSFPVQSGLQKSDGYPHQAG